MNSPMQMALRLYRDAGFLCEVTEWFDSRTNRKHDFFTIGDFVAIHPRFAGITIVQATSRDNHATRVGKVAQCPFTVRILEAKNRIHVVSYGTKGNHLQRRITAFCLTSTPRVEPKTYELDLPTERENGEQLDALAFER